MNESTTKTMLAIWLARRHTEERLSPAEESALKNIVHQLAERRDRWNSIEQALIALIQENAALQQAYTPIRAELDEMDSEELLGLFPRETDLEQISVNPDNLQTYDSTAKIFNADSESVDRLLAKLLSEIARSQLETQLQFEILASEWHEQVAGSSFVAEKISHPAYQKIIAMGSTVIPLLLRELEKRPTHWFEALKAITGANPIQPEQRGRIKQMAEAWLKWGRENGYQW